MLIKDIMTRGVETVSPQTTLQEAAARMKTLDVGPLPVCDGDRIEGMVTDRDIVVRGIAEGRDPRTTKVSDVMTRDVVTCAESDDVRVAARTMKEKQIRRLLVVDDKQKVSGIVSLGDVAVEGDDKMSGDVLEKVSTPSSGMKA
jgi:CBS domain-containing protein